MFKYLDQIKSLFRGNQPRLSKQQEAVWRSLIESHAEVVTKTGSTNAEEIQIILGNKKEGS
jgi:hypothetical protein